MRGVWGDVTGRLPAVSNVGFSPHTCDFCTVDKVSTFDEIIQNSRGITNERKRQKPVQR